MRSVDKADVAFVAVAVIIIAVLAAIPTGFRTNEYPNSTRAKVSIVDVDNGRLYSAGGVILLGAQTCKVRVLGGRFEGQEAVAVNDFIGKLEMDKVFFKGDTALAVLDYDDDRITAVTLIDHYRLDLETILFAGFMLVLILFAGWTGLKALITFVLTTLMIWKLMIPAFLKGLNPIAVSMLVVIFLTVATISLVGGFNRKSLVAILGSLAGTILTGILAIVFGRHFKIHGAILPFSETLLYAGYAHLNLTDIFISGMFIASAGALMDLAMDISAAINELVHKNPDISMKEAIMSGFSIGRAVIGTQTTTLLLAYSGGYVALLMVFMAQGTPVINILNLKYVAAEVLHTIVGSFGLVTVAPFTAILAGVVYTQKAYLTRIREQCSTH